MGFFSQKAAGRQRFLAPYYVANLLLIVSYGLARAWFLTQFQDQSNKKYTRVYQLGALYEKERYALSMLAAALAIKYWRWQSIDAFLSDALTYSKTLVGLMVWYMDWRISLYYLLLCLVSYLLFPQPIYQGASALEHFTPASFYTEVVEKHSQADVTWLVEFYAPWAPPCIHLEPVVAELSLKYTTQQLRFGKVDASRWPQLAKQHKVAVYGTLPQLPTFIMFKSGKEHSRIPHVYEDGTVAAIRRIKREDIVTAFGLDDYLEDAKKKQKAAGVSSRASSGGGSTKKRR